jgi:hypothetical protein
MDEIVKNLEKMINAAGYQSDVNTFSYVFAISKVNNFCWDDAYANIQEGLLGKSF